MSGGSNVINVSYVSCVQGCISRSILPSDMRFVKKFTPPYFQAKNFTPLISPNFDSFGDKKHKKMSEDGEIYTAGKNFTLPPAVTALTNLTSAYHPGWEHAE